MKRIRRLTAVLATTIALVVSLSPVQSRADVATETLRTMSDRASWSGTFVAGALAAGPGLPGLCVDRAVCDRIELTVDLPADNWSAPGGLLVSIQWSNIDAGYDLGLYVYGPDGSQVAKSDTLALSQAEAAWVMTPSNGTYTIVVSPRTVVGQPIVAGMIEPLHYEGFVHLQRGVTVSRTESNLGQPYSPTFVAIDRTDAEPVTELLPDLQPTTPANFHIESGTGAHIYSYADRGVRHQPSCYPAETLGLTSDTPTPGQGPLKCLRWDQGEYNFGAGAFELHNYPNKGAGTEVIQRIYRTDGSVRQQQIPGAVKFSQTHGHMHYFGFQTVTLRARNADGTPGAAVRPGVDKGICMVDVKNGWFGTSKGQPHGYALPSTCDTAMRRDPNDPTYPNEPFFQMGITPGWADIYPWFIADQYLDITGLADGQYVLDVRQNQTGGVIESDYANNTASACVDISGETAAAC